MLLFDEVKHKYWYDEDPGLKLTSVSKIIEHYHEAFDRKGLSVKTANKRKTSVETILEEWDTAIREGQERGTKYHNMREEREFQNQNVHRHPTQGSYKVGLDLDSLKPGIYPELMLDHPYYGITGTSDRVEIFEDRTFDLSDFKTNKKLEFNSFRVFDPITKQRYPKMMYPPISHLEDCSGIHYTIQLSLYAFFLEERGYTLRDMWIEHVIFEDDQDVNVVKYPINYLRKEAKNICEHFKLHYE